MATSKAKPWSVGSGPSAAKIRELAQTHTRSSLAELYGVSYAVASDWLRNAGVEFEDLERMSHKRYIPWRVKVNDTHHGIARALRGMSTIAQGGEPTRGERLQAMKLQRHLDTPCDGKHPGNPHPPAPHGMVVHYDRREGWQLVPRDPERDEPGMPVLQPWSV